MIKTKTDTRRKQTRRKSTRARTLMLTDSAPVQLPKKGAFWRIEKGPVNLYCEIGGRRYRLAQFSDGQVFPNAGSLRHSFALFVSGEAGAKLKPVTLRQVDKDKLASSADEFIKGIAVFFFQIGEKPAANASIATTGKQPFLQDETTLVSPGKVLWLAPKEDGGLNPCGLDEIKGLPAYFPVYGNLWTKIQAGTQLTIYQSAQLAASGNLPKALNDLFDLLPDLIKAVEQTADRQALARIEANEREISEQVSRGIAELETVGPGIQASGVEGERDSATAAVRFALMSLGLATEKKTPVNGETGFSAIPEIARQSGARTRKILLTGKWWTEDLGPIIAKLDSNGGKGEERVIALVRKGNGYSAFAPLSGDRVKVTPDVADSIRGQAFTLYPPLPESISGLRDIAMFLLPMIRADIRPLILVGLVTGAVGALIPIATALIIDTLIPGSEIELLIQVGIGLACAAGLTWLMSITKSLTLLRINGRSGSLLRAALWDRLLKLPASFFKSYSAGDLNQRISGFESIRSAVLNVVLSSALTATFSIFYLGLLFIYDVRLALLGVVLVVIFALITFAVGLIQIKYVRKAAAVSGLLSGFVFQLLQGIVKLRVAGAEARGFARWASQYAEERRAIISIRNINNHFGAFADAFHLLSLAAIFGAAVYISNASFSPGIFIAFIAAFSSFQSAFMGLSNAALSLFAVMPHFERGKPILEAEIEERLDAADPGILSGAISVSNVTFAYSEGSVPVLQDVSFEIAPGEHVAIVGPSGSGKSTLLRVLLGFEKPQSGTVLYDNQELASLDVTAVRRQIGVVLQTGRIFAGTIYDNIKGAGLATLEDCMQAAEEAGFAEDLKMFPMGLHTPLTEGAQTISGGQRQRILIARALAAKPRILFMDEATSALDNRTQAIVTESLNALSVTRIVIAHRLSTVRNADKICVIEGGKLVEQGSYDELMALDGTFARLAERQLT